MNKCKNCGNKNLPKNSKYCNNCGSFLKLAKKEIQYKPQKYRTLQLLKETLIEGSKIINKNKNGNLSTTQDVQIYHSLIWQYLIETTNIKDKLKYINEETFTESVMGLLYDLKQYSNENCILDEFLYKINNTYEENKSMPKIERKFIFYTNGCATKLIFSLFF